MWLFFFIGLFCAICLTQIILNKVKSIQNVLQVRPLFKQATFQKQFYLLYALNQSHAEHEHEVICILVSTECLDLTKVFDEDNQHNITLLIYPPWLEFDLIQYIYM